MNGYLRAGAFVAEPALQDARFLDCVGQNQFARDIAAGRVKLADELFQHSRVRFAFRVVNRARIAADQLAVADKHDLYGGVALVASQGDDIVIGHVLANGFMLVGDVVYGL